MANRKKSFVLLELMIAFAIVSACVVPLVSMPHISYKHQSASLRAIELERIAMVSFAEIIEGLRSFDKCEPAGALPPLEGCNRSFCVKTTNDAHLQNGEHYKYLTISLDIDKQKFSKTLLIKKNEKKVSNTN